MSFLPWIVCNRTVPPCLRSVTSRLAQLGASKTRNSRRLRQPAALVSLGAFVFSASLVAQHAEQPAKRQIVTPQVTGSDGSQTGTANFFGNFTTISAPTGALTVFHETDCSLTLATGTYTIHPNFTYSQTQLATNYEQVLHSEAQLTTTPDVFAKPCMQRPTPGFGSRPGAFLGTTTSGVDVFAAIGLIYPNMVEGVYVLTRNITVSLTSFQFSTAGALAAADLNKDGNGDLIVVDNATASTSHVTVLLGNADGTFTSGVAYPIGGDYSVAAVVDDVNGDGKLDIVAVSGDQQISVLLGNGDGTFQAALSFAAPTLPGYANAAATPIQNMVTADLRGNGKKDIICSNGLVLLGNGDGTFSAGTPAFPYAQDSVYSMGPNIASGDFNNDGKIDLAIDAGRAVSLLTGNGDGTFTTGKSYAAINSNGFVTVDDLDGDGNPDIVVGLGDGGAYGGDVVTPGLSYALMGNGDGTFQGAPALNSGAYNGTNLLDLNGDGAPDLVTSSSSGTLTVELNNGKGSFTPGANIAPPASFSVNGYNFTMTSSAQASTFAVADVNGDNKPDVIFIDNGLTATSSGGGLPITYPYPVLFVARGNGDGTFQTAAAYAFPQIAAATGFDNTNTVSSLQIADLNHDNKPDLICVYNETAGGSGVNPYNQGIAVLPGIGDGTFQAPVLTSTYSSTSAPTTALVPRILSVTDLTGDNSPDLIVNIPGTTIVNFQLQTQLETFVSKGDGTFNAPTTVTVGANSYALAVADFNKDNKPDLAVLAENSSSQAELVELPGNGNGTFGTAAVSNLAGGDAIRSDGIAAADFDGDMNPDIALFDSNNTSGIFYGKGDGTFTSVPLGGNIVPKDLISVSAGSPAVAADLNKDGLPDILAGGTSLINITGTTVVTKATTTTSLVSALNPAVVGASVQFTATVTGTGTPTGAVTFMDGTTTLGTGTLSAGVATYSTNSLTAASHSITAVYGGDANFNGSTSNTVSEVVNKSTPTVTVTPGSLTLTTAQPLSVTVSVGATTGNPTPTGSVVLSGGGYTSAATALVNGSATINIAAGALATGTDTLTANYTPDSGSSSTYNAASGTGSVTVSNVPTFSLSNSGAISIAAAATTGNTATVTVTPAAGFTGAVALTCAVTTAPTGATSPATCAVSSPVTITGATAQTATLTVTTTSATTVGAYAVTVTATSASITQTSVVGVTVTTYIPAPDFALSSGAAITVSRGATTGNTTTITVTPSGGFTGNVTLAAVLTSSPAGAANVPTLSFGSTSPVAITGTAAGTATLTVGTMAATSAALAWPHSRGIPWYATGGATLACILILGIPARRRRWRSLFGIALLLVPLVGGIASCGGSSSGNGGGTGSPGTTTGSYTITVTGTLGSTAHTTTVNLTVN